MTKSVQLNKNIHLKLKAISDKRRAEGHPVSSMSGIMGEFILNLHKKEFK